MLSGLAALAVIPARGGSKGIPRKNLALVAGRSLIAHAAELVASLDWLDRVVLSTDDDEIAEEGLRSGLEVIERPSLLASDNAENVHVWNHAWLEAEQLAGLRFEISLLLQPTSPLRKDDDVRRCVNELIEQGRDAVVTVSPTPAHFAPEKTMSIGESGELSTYLGDGFKSIRQDIPSYYFLNGYCYAARRGRVVDEVQILGPNTGAVIIDRPVVNIDEPFDLEVAEWLIQLEQDRAKP